MRITKLPLLGASLAIGLLGCSSGDSGDQEFQDLDGASHSFSIENLTKNVSTEQGLIKFDAHTDAGNYGINIQFFEGVAEIDVVSLEGDGIPEMVSIRVNEPPNGLDLALAGPNGVGQSGQVGMSGKDDPIIGKAFGPSLEELAELVAMVEQDPPNPAGYITNARNYSGATIMPLATAALADALRDGSQAEQLIYRRLAYAMVHSYGYRLSATGELLDPSAESQSDSCSVNTPCSYTQVCSTGVCCIGCYTCGFLWTTMCGQADCCSCTGDCVRGVCQGNCES